MLKSISLTMLNKLLYYSCQFFPTTSRATANVATTSCCQWQPAAVFPCSSVHHTPTSHVPLHAASTPSHVLSGSSERRRLAQDGRRRERSGGKKNPASEADPDADRRSSTQLHALPERGVTEQYRSTTWSYILQQRCSKVGLFLSCR